MLDHSIQLIFGLVIALMGLRTYLYYFKVNKTPDVDLMDVYVARQMDKRYRNKGLGKR